MGGAAEGRKNRCLWPPPPPASLVPLPRCAGEDERRVHKPPTAMGLGISAGRRTAPTGPGPNGSPQIVARPRPAGATGMLHLAPADRGGVPGTARLATGRQRLPALPREGAYPHGPDPRSKLRTFPCRHPAPLRELCPWPPVGDRGACGSPLSPEGEYPAGRNFGKEGATPSTRSCPREPFARDPVQRGVSGGRLRVGGRWGDKILWRFLFGGGGRHT